MLSIRFANNGKARLPLNSLQVEQREEIQRHIDLGDYVFEETSCVVCEGNNFRSLSEKDRYGIYMPVAICRDCGLIQATPRMSQESYAHFYNDGHRRLYVGKEKPGEAYFQGRYRAGRAAFEFLSQHMEISGKRILEVGCGSGAILKYLYDTGADVKGIDLSREYLDYGRARYNLDLSSVSLFDMPDSHEFDLVIYSDVMEHILNPKEHLQKIRSLLKENGLLYIKVPGVKNTFREYRGDFLKSLQNAHVVYFTSTTLRNLMRSCGFAMLYANEEVRSLWRVQDIQSVTFENDYFSCMHYLNRLERRFISRSMLHAASVTINILRRVKK